MIHWWKIGIFICWLFLSNVKMNMVVLGRNTGTALTFLTSWLRSVSTVFPPMWVLSLPLSLSLSLRLSLCSQCFLTLVYAFRLTWGMQSYTCYCGSPQSRELWKGIVNHNHFIYGHFNSVCQNEELKVAGSRGAEIEHKLLTARFLQLTYTVQPMKPCCLPQDRHPAVTSPLFCTPSPGGGFYSSTKHEGPMLRWGAFPSFKVDAPFI
jgi:hypothetical protein